MPDRPTPDELDRLIDGLLGGADVADAEDLRHAYALLSAARRVRALGDEPVPASVRHRHLAAIRTAAAEHTVPAPVRTGSSWLVTLRRRGAAVAAATSLTFAATGGGAVALAQDADPGDPLYGLKRASESVALAVSSDDAGLHLRFAERRLDELEAVPDQAADLATAAARQLDLAEEHGADLTEVGAHAVERLAAVVDHLGSDNARIAVSRACARIATRHAGTDAAAVCGDDGLLPGASGDAPGRTDPPGRSGDAPGKTDDEAVTGDTPGRRGDAPGRTEGRSGDGTPDRPDGAGPPDGIPDGGTDGALTD